MDSTEQEKRANENISQSENTKLIYRLIHELSATVRKLVHFILDREPSMNSMRIEKQLYLENGKVNWK